MTVADFKPKARPKPAVWVCDCGCQNFWLYRDGRIECAECNLFHDSMTGYWKLIDITAPVRFRVRQPDGSYIEETQDEGQGQAEDC